MTASPTVGLLAALTFAVFTGTTTAQVGWRDEGIPNATTTGSSVLTSRVYYPSTVAGLDAPLRTQLGGYPVVVYLHGLGASGRSYSTLGERLAAAGFISVHCDTGQEHDRQADDGFALFDSLRAENVRPTSFFRGALDMGRAAVAGHSMGGASTVKILARNPGYLTGIGFAAWHGHGAYPPLYGPQVTSSLLMIHGAGDGVCPWQLTAQAFYDNATSFTGLKSFVLLNGNCDHGNLVWLRTTPGGMQVFDRSMDTAIGWLSNRLRGEVEGLEDVVGPALVNDPVVTIVQSEYREPKLWVHGAAPMGGTINLRVAGQPGVALLMVADTPANVPTNVGTVLLDPATLNWTQSVTVGGPAQTVTLNVPNDPRLVGFSLWFQAMSFTDGHGVRLSNSDSQTATR